MSTTTEELARHGRYRLPVRDLTDTMVGKYVVIPVGQHYISGLFAGVVDRGDRLDVELVNAVTMHSTVHHIGTVPVAVGWPSPADRDATVYPFTCRHCGHAVQRSIVGQARTHKVVAWVHVTGPAAGDEAGDPDRRRNCVPSLDGSPLAEPNS